VRFREDLPADVPYALRSFRSSVAVVKCSVRNLEDGSVKGVTFSLRAVCLGLMLMPSLSAAEQPPAILQITIERIHASGEAAYGAIEEKLREVCVRLGCPNRYLALESIASPKEVWWLVAYATEDDVDRVAQSYARNEQLLNAMNDLAALKSEIVDAPTAHMTSHRVDSSDGAAWRVGFEPFVVIAEDAGSGAVFESREHRMFTFAAAASLPEAEAAAAKLGATARPFRVRPSWSVPEDAWAAANPQLWRTGAVGVEVAEGLDLAR
jgi:hypothetical protein